jgi:hypothetical protein
MKTEHLKLIKNCVDIYHSNDAIGDRIYELFGNCDSQFMDNVFGIFDKYLDLVEETIGDEIHSLSWFIYDNQCGKKKLEHTINGKLVPIKTVDDLVRVIEDR